MSSARQGKEMTTEKTTVRILSIHTMMFHRHAWQQAAKLLAKDGVHLACVQQHEATQVLGEEDFDLLVADISMSGQDMESIMEQSQNMRHRLGVSAESPAGFTTFDSATRMDFTSFTAQLSPENYAGAMLLVAHRAGFDVPLQEKKPVQTCGIYHPQAKETFFSVGEYLAWQKERGLLCQRMTAILFYYGQLVEESLTEIDRLIQRCEEEGLCPLAIFSAGIEEGAEQPDWYSLLEQISDLGVIVSCMAGRLLKQEGDTKLLERLDVPVIQTLRSHTQTPEEWQEDPQGLPAMSAVFSQTYPEIFGAIRPTMFAALQEDLEQEKSTWIRKYQPIEERITALVQRLVRHFRLRETPASQKRLTIVLHNNPCKGVEATVGMAVGLDTFTSLVALLTRLQEQGYDIGDCPLDGEALLQEFLARKAIAEFRWTTVDEIVTKGGCLFMMGKAEYQSWFDQQPEAVRHKIIEDWGPFPGEGMAWKEAGEDVLLITGLRYGKIHIINQPKRGCYGAKCTGEVCRILHDPALSPPHHWFATYKYIRDRSDALIHFGTEGALEYLPGKQNGLSGTCFSEVTLGDIPNFYVYVMDAIGEGMVAKRRGQATLIDHMGPVFSPLEPDEQMLSLENLLDQYLAAQNSQDTHRALILEKEIIPLLTEVELGDGASTLPLQEQIDLVRRRLAAIQRTLSPEGLHVLGQAPSNQARGRLLATMLRKPPAGITATERLGIYLPGEGTAYKKVSELLASITPDSQTDNRVSPELRSYCLELVERLAQTDQELDHLLLCLEGRYLMPGPAGSLSSGRIDLLPTGRNFYGKDVSLLPTRAAHMVGKDMANALLQKYMAEEGRFPQRVGLSIWSSDAFKSDGELFCQILFLMGVQPCWDQQGKVEGLEVIPLQDLSLNIDGEVHLRPRVDLTIETSGIMRDMVPHFCDLLDQAVVLVSELDESHEWNFVKKHSDEMLADLQSDTATTLSQKEMRRMSTFRLFSSAPGTYGLGVGLALDASAWTTDTELAEIYINWGGHALTQGENSIVARDILAKQLAGLDIAAMKQASEEYDILDCSCYAVSQGSMATASRALSGKEVKLYWTEAGDGHELCAVKEQLQRSAATRLLNKRWIASMKDHGYQGAMAVGSRVNNLYKWSATSHAVSKDLFDRVVTTYIDDEENRLWLMENNPYAMEEITRRLLEAASRGLWLADDDLLENVKHMALEVEGEMEERMGEVNEEFQGSQVEVLGADMVEKWQHEWRIG